MQLSDLSDFLSPDTYFEVQKQTSNILSRKITKTLNKEFEEFDWEYDWCNSKEIPAPETRTDEVDEFIKEKMRGKYLEFEKKINGITKICDVEEIYQIQSVLSELNIDTDLADGIESKLMDTIKKWFL